MKKICYLAAAVFAAVLLWENALYARPLRLHILANSDSPADQQVKLAVRDAILEEAALSAALTEELAEEAVRKNLDSVLATANETLEKHGFSYHATAELGEYDFPLRQYAERIYPAGKYRALRIVLGEGAGHNWWCVLYPPLCTTTADTQQTELRSFLYEWLKGVFHA